ncbi:hypothetical protein OKA04_03770 [Luteolibacter flavescens]|uniref:Uncharacterized protein n=1 Tax=Luteolibacter flavescens TaxID=1859460 RepID=A0ABT3FJW2_9BACT|nr:hypothetical protein [Luteolibacter flavescens]MCW1883831.1 hypothetical protein [Luteolibacter flavescens]
MIRAKLRAYARYFVLSSIFVAGSASLHAQDEFPGHQRTQEISLHKGWNAVYLEVDPADGAPATVFSGLPVDKVATLFKNPGNQQFVSDPAVSLTSAQGWGVWYASELPEAFLKSLDEINGNRAYLIHAKSDCKWSAKGRVTGDAVTWQPDTFNFTGFPVAAVGGPTFAQFFAGSKAHKNQAIYRLVSGRWKQVLQPTAEAMRSGEAFWIYCKGPSTYQGPLRAEASGGRIALGRGVAELTLRNEAPHPLTPTIHHVAGDASPLPLSILIKTFGDPAAPVKSVPVNFPASGWQQPLPALEISGAFAVPFECRSGELLRPLQGSLLKITTDLGTETWVPVSGRRDDLGK